MDKKFLFIISLIYSLFFLLLPKLTQAADFVIPKISIGIDKSQNHQDVALTLQILILLTILTLVPSIVIMLTSFIRILIVLSFARQALALQQVPPQHVITALALFLTLFIMAPTINKIYTQAAKPYFEGKLSAEIAIKKATEPLRNFMFRYTREKDIDLFLSLGKLKRPKNQEEVPTYVLIPAFMISELTTAFKMGILLFLPFLIIDMIVASIIMSMGMIMLPPAMISLPFKVLLFVMVDGWHLLVNSIIQSF
jgi:flagellar biosynthetic protein FliP